MDAKTYFHNKFNRYYGGQSVPLYTALQNALDDPRLKIELLPPPPRFEAHRDMGYFASRWTVLDVLAQPPITIGTFFDEARAIDYAKWQNSLERE